MSDELMNELTRTTLENLEKVAKSQTVIGDPIQLSADTKLIPVSKVYIGFATGGSELTSNSGGKHQPVFCGGTGGGATVTPQAFIMLADGEMKIISMEQEQGLSETVLKKGPDTLKKLQQLLQGSSKKKSKRRDGNEENEDE